MRKIALAALLLLALELSQAEPPKKEKRERRESKERHESHNWIIERQQSGSVSSESVPIMQRIRGGREIDVYRDGSMWERNNYVGSIKR